MNNEELAMHLQIMIDNLEEHTDNDEYMLGYIRACKEILEKIKG